MSQNWRLDGNREVGLLVSHDGPVIEFLVTHLDSIDERLLDYLDKVDETWPQGVKRLCDYTNAPTHWDDQESR